MIASVFGALHALHQGSQGCFILTQRYYVLLMGSTNETWGKFGPLLVDTYNEAATFAGK